MNQSLPSLHACFIDRVRKAVAGDDRLDALLAGGSYIHGGMDVFSDVDLVIVAKEAAYEEVLNSRYEFAGSLGSLLTAFTGEHVGEPRLLICLYGPDLLHVDLKFVTASDLDHRVERPAILFSRDVKATAARLDQAQIAWPNAGSEWFEARAWIWLHYAATKFLRGELLEAIGMLSFFRDQVLGPMWHRRAGRPQRGVRRIESYDLDSTGKLSATVAMHERNSVKAAILAAIDLYVDLRADDPPGEPVKGMPEGLIQFLGE